MPDPINSKGSVVTEKPVSSADLEKSEGLAKPSAQVGTSSSIPANNNEKGNVAKAAGSAGNSEYKEVSKPGVDIGSSLGAVRAPLFGSVRNVVSLLTAAEHAVLDMAGTISIARNDENGPRGELVGKIGTLIA